jgi:endonuclease III
LDEASHSPTYMKTKFIKINELLIKRFGIPKRNKKRPDPVDLLIATILSQNTNDRNSYKAFQNLKIKYGSWEKIAALHLTKLKNTIKIAGLGEQKSRTIKRFLAELIKSKGKISLDHLKKLRDEEILNELTQHPGIGIKTASCVLLFSLNRNVCPVDTHVHRTLNRIGIVQTNIPEKTFYQVLNYIPEGAAHSIHTNLIRLGREICRPSKPLCSVCPLRKICLYPYKNNSRSVPTGGNNFMLLDNVF